MATLRGSSESAIRTATISRTHAPAAALRDISRMAFPGCASALLPGDVNSVKRTRIGGAAIKVHPVDSAVAIMIDANTARKMVSAGEAVSEDAAGWNGSRCSRPACSSIFRRPMSSAVNVTRDIRYHTDFVWSRIGSTRAETIGANVVPDNIRIKRARR